MTKRVIINVKFKLTKLRGSEEDFHREHGNTLEVNNALNDPASDDLKLMSC